MVGCPSSKVLPPGVHCVVGRQSSRCRRVRISWPKTTSSDLTARSSPFLPALRADVQATVLTTLGDRGERLLTGVRDQLDRGDEALLCVAFASRGGVHLLSRQLERLGPCGRLLVTNVFGTTSAEALAAASDMGIEVRILNLGGGTYHPKLYLSSSGAAASATIGSANLTNGLVGNVEVAIRMDGELTEPSLADAWAIGEGLWAHPDAKPWSPVHALTRTDEELEEDLRALLETQVALDPVFLTLRDRRPNRVVDLVAGGLWIETDASTAKGHAAQLVPAWMLQLAWDHLQLHGELTNRYLIADDGLNVKRSSAVCAVLARLPGVESVPGRSITLRRTA